MSETIQRSLGSDPPNALSMNVCPVASVAGAPNTDSARVMAQPGGGAQIAPFCALPSPPSAVHFAGEWSTATEPWDGPGDLERLCRVLLVCR